MRVRVTTLTRMASLLEAFTATTPRWRLSELAAHLGWDLATTHRFANALVDIRVLERGSDGSFAVGLLPVELAAVYVGAAPSRQRLVNRAELITQESGLTTQIAVLDGNRATVISSFEGRSALKAAALLGQRLPLHATAVGKAILSQLQPGAAEALLDPELERFTPQTLGRAKVLEQIADIRRGALAQATSELEHGLYALAIPLAESHFGAPAGLTCAGPGPDLLSEHWEKAADLLRAIAPAVAPHQMDGHSYEDHGLAYEGETGIR